MSQNCGSSWIIYQHSRTQLIDETRAWSPIRRSLLCIDVLRQNLKFKQFLQFCLRQIGKGSKSIMFLWEFSLIGVVVIQRRVKTGIVTRKFQVRQIWFCTNLKAVYFIIIILDQRAKQMFVIMFSDFCHQFLQYFIL